MWPLLARIESTRGKQRRVFVLAHRHSHVVAETLTTLVFALALQQEITTIIIVRGVNVKRLTLNRILDRTVLENSAFYDACFGAVRANSAGVRFASDPCGRSWLYSRRQRAACACASARDSNQLALSSS